MCGLRYSHTLMVPQHEWLVLSQLKQQPVAVALQLRLQSLNQSWQHGWWLRHKQK